MGWGEGKMGRWEDAKMGIVGMEGRRFGVGVGCAARERRA